MLRSLSIRNYALIEELELKPSASLTVMTGETGAGKSIILGALGLLLGDRADSKALWNENEKCVIEGSFAIEPYKLQSLFETNDLDYQPETVIRRELSPGGKSRAFINDTPVNLEVLRQLGTRLVDIHSQHETLLLASNSFQLRLIDTFAQNQAHGTAYGLAWAEFTSAGKEFETLKEQASRLRGESDFVSFQLDELVKARLQTGEQESLEESLKLLEHAGDIKVRLTTALAVLSESEDSALNQLAALRNQLQPLAGYSSAFGDLLKRVESLIIEARDIRNEIEREEARVEADPAKAEEVQSRLSLIYQLQSKHRAKTVSDLLSLQDTLQQQADKTTTLDEDLARAEQRYTAAEEHLKKNARTLRESRTAVFRKLEALLTGLLKDLGIPQAGVSIAHTETEPGPTGSDRVEILFSANKGIEPRPLSQVASGGEFARVMFAMKFIMAEKAALPTLVLDEIDMGVSGEIAVKLGRMMKEMASRHQVIVISHLPQIAARGVDHLLVYKDTRRERTVSRIRPLDRENRVKHIAEMLAGARPTEAALQNARELIDMDA
jgi:DNA repair protein RecN (Recombination protein N)